MAQRQQNLGRFELFYSIYTLVTSHCKTTQNKRK